MNLDDRFLESIAEQTINLDTDSDRLRRAAELLHLMPGKMAITIHRNGDWSYQGSMFNRPAMVDLLAKSLVAFNDRYYLLAPEQLLEITVEDLPFLVIDLNRSIDHHQVIATTNLGQSVVINDEHACYLSAVPGMAVKVPCVGIRSGIAARLSRPMYYQILDWCEVEETGEGQRLFLHSDGCQFELGAL
tara:strand:- start:728 stop:1294 length:567 start_codon:yes stop_codon:yes gene_type:complete